MIRRLLLDRPTGAHMQFARYFFVGGSAAVVDLVTYTVILKMFGLHYVACAFIGYMAGLAWNHVLCGYWGFESKHKKMKEILMVIFIAIGGLLWTWLILYLLIDLMSFDEIGAKMVSQILVLFWNFSMRKIFVFA